MRGWSRLDRESIAHVERKALRLSSIGFGSPSENAVRLSSEILDKPSIRSQCL